jgi:hypothetical protein
VRIKVGDVGNTRLFSVKSVAAPKIMRPTGWVGELEDLIGTLEEAPFLLAPDPLG